MRIIVMISAMLLTVSCFCQAVDHQAQIRQILMRQTQLIALIDDNKEDFLQYHELLATTSGEDFRASALQAIAEIGDFWEAQGIPIKPSPSNATVPLVELALSTEPSSDEYLPLSNLVSRYLWLQQQYSFDLLAIGWLLKPDQQHPSVPQLSRRLKALGFLPTFLADNVIYNSDLVSAIKIFQRQHGLKVDGVVGPETLKWLNVSPYQRAKLLANNFVVRTRYLAKTGNRYLLVNIPAFEMVLIDEDVEQLRSRVIVGKPYRPTPQLSGQISNVVINPSWRVPRNIIRRDLVPKIRNNGHYISERQFDVYDVKDNLIDKSAEEWQQLATGYFPFRLVQKPGDLNALGRYKFHFENRHSVYLLDTADKELFDQANRALSSGCIRVESVDALANWMAATMVKDKQKWVELQRSKQQTQWFSLHGRLPVHLVYWTAWVDGNHQPQFRNDIYSLMNNYSEDKNILSKNH